MNIYYSPLSYFSFGRREKGKMQNHMRRTMDGNY